MVTDGLDILHAAADTAYDAYREAAAARTRAELSATAMMGADGTDFMLVDVLVEERIIDAISGFGVNILSEEAGWIDNGSARTLVMDPVDGSANAAVGVPSSASAA